MATISHQAVTRHQNQRTRHGFQVHLGHQRAGGIDHIQVAFLGLAPHRRRHTVSAENGARANRHLAQLFHENRPGFAQFVHNVLVMHDFLADINRRAVQIQRDFDHIDGSHDTGAETSRLEQEYLLVRAVIRCERL